MPDQLRCISPVDNKLYVQRCLCSDSELAAALADARRAQRDWQQRPLGERIAIAERALAYFEEHRDIIAEQISWQMGRPIQYAGGEINGLLERGRYMLDIAPAALADVEPGPIAGGEHFIRRNPVGLVLTVAPWNYPLLTTVNSVLPALVAGNAVLLKPSAQTPLAGEHFQRAFAQAGLPQGLLQCLHLGHQQTRALLNGGELDFCSFTGSVAAGADMEQAAAGSFMGLGLELGGKDPAYVRADLDSNGLASAVSNLVDGAFFNSGQSCCGIERIYVARRHYKDFCEAFIAEVKQYRLGNPMEHSTSLGPMVRASAANWVRGQTKAALAAGARACIDSSGFALDNGDGAYLAPQVLVDVNHSMSVMREESFGPVVGIMPVADDRQALALMNDSDLGLSASIWSSDKAAALALGEQLQTGTVFINRCDYLDPALAWTGVKNTGRGASLSALGYHQLTQPKSYHIKMG
ncbi:MAG: aldehyde dehydrogenase family protein [Cellvibrionaceae bacterium]|nr:aldehyde dehydrogenase family protein [Cellvibrionaceae bacterium]MCV6626228.1 aldehyde dehydrogenase family protein [Cellvibrionaceae bacterium]